MLFNAIRSELFRLRHNTTAMFWGLFFMPIVGFVAGIFWRNYLGGRSNAARMATPDGQPLEQVVILGDRLAEKTATLAEPGMMAFFLLVSAAISASDFRWETWRLVRPRNSRENLIYGKAIAIALLAFVPMTGLLVAEALGQIVSALVDRHELRLGFEPGLAGAGVVMFLIAWLRICQFALVSLLAALITRSMSAAIMVPVALGIGSYVLQKVAIFMGWRPTDWLTLLAFPAQAHDTIQAALLGARTDGNVLLLCVAGLLFWIALPVAASVWLFQQQDLAKE